MTWPHDCNNGLSNEATLVAVVVAAVVVDMAASSSSSRSSWSLFLKRRHMLSTKMLRGFTMSDTVASPEDSQKSIVPARPDLDPRLDPRLRNLIAPWVAAGSPAVSAALSVPELNAMYNTMEVPTFEMRAPFYANSTQEGLKSWTIDIAISDRAKPLRLYINRPDDQVAYPCFVYLRGGGMALGSGHYSQPISRNYAREGLVVVTPDFRNSKEEGGEFPNGLEDCYAGLEWALAHKEELNRTDKVVVGGESGGGNLTIATCLLAKERHLDGISGLYTQCPFIGGPTDLYGEYDGYFISKDTAGYYKTYTPNGVDEARRHVAFPHYATVDHLIGFPPTVVHVNECDPLTHEGIEFYRKLLAAGVTARLIILGGTLHASQTLSAVLPEISKSFHQDVANFARYL